MNRHLKFKIFCILICLIIFIFPVFASGGELIDTGLYDCSWIKYENYLRNPINIGTTRFSYMFAVMWGIGGMNSDYNYHLYFDIEFDKSLDSSFKIKFLSITDTKMKYDDVFELNSECNCNYIDLGENRYRFVVTVSGIDSDIMYYYLVPAIDSGVNYTVTNIDYYIDYVGVGGPFFSIGDLKSFILSIIGGLKNINNGNLLIVIVSSLSIVAGLVICWFSFRFIVRRVRYSLDRGRL